MSIRIFLGVVIAGSAAIVLCLLMAPKPAVAQTAEATQSYVRGTQCLAKESVVFSCPLKSKKVASVCRSGNVLTFRYGRQGKPDVVITGDAKSNSVFLGMQDDKRSSEAALRFVQGKRSYVAYSGTFYSDDPKPRKSIVGGVAIGESNARDAKEDGCVQARDQSARMKAQDLVQTLPWDEPNSPWDMHW